MHTNYTRNAGDSSIDAPMLERGTCRNRALSFLLSPPSPPLSTENSGHGGGGVSTTRDDAPATRDASRATGSRHVSRNGQDVTRPARSTKTATWRTLREDYSGQRGVRPSPPVGVRPRFRRAGGTADRVERRRNTPPCPLFSASDRKEQRTEWCVERGRRPPPIASRLPVGISRRCDRRTDQSPSLGRSADVSRSIGVSRLVV